MSNQIKNITGMKFGRLTVLEFSHIQNRTARWRCICDCGKKKIASVLKPGSPGGAKRNNKQKN